MRGGPGVQHQVDLVWKSCSATYCVTLGKLLNFSEHQLSGDNNNCINLTGLLRRCSEMILVEGFA